MRNDPRDLDRAVALLDPAPVAGARDRTGAVGPRAQADLEAILAGEREVEDVPGPVPPRAVRIARVAVPVAATAAGAVLLAQALLGGPGEVRLADPESLEGESASGVVEQCRDELIERVGEHGHDEPGAEAFWAARVMLVEERGDLALVVLQVRDSGEEYRAECLFQQGQRVVIGVGIADPPIPSATPVDGVPEQVFQRLVWGEVPEGATAVTATTDAGDAVEVAFYPEVGLYTMVWPEGVALDGEVVLTLADGTTQTQPL